MTTNSEPGELIGFVDTNVFVRFFFRDNPDLSERSRQLFDQVETGRFRVKITDTVVFETVYALEKIYQVPRQAIADAWVSMLSLPGIEIPSKAILLESFALWSGRGALSFADCFHLFSAKAMGLDTMITFDRKMSFRA